jgi:Fic family protein
MYENLESLKTLLDARRPFSPEQQSRIEAVLLPRRIYYSNAFSTNTLTLDETRYFLETQRMVGGKLEREFNEIKGLLAAIQYLNSWPANQDLSQENILALHATLTTPIGLDENYSPGRYRTQDLPLLGRDGSRLNFLPFDKIPAEMTQLLDWYHSDSAKLHPLELAARFHYRFSLIHPFVEANGRMARLLDDFILVRGGYTPALPNSREKYFTAMRVADQSLPADQRVRSATHADLSQFITVMGECLAVGMQMILDVLEERLTPQAKDLESRLEIFDRILAGDTTGESDRLLREEKETTKLAMAGDTTGESDRLLREEKETTKLAIAREVGETLKDKVRSKVVQFSLSGPAKFQHNDHLFSPLIAEVTSRHNAVFSASEVQYEYHLGPDLAAIEQSGLPVTPFMKLLGFAILSFDHTVGIFSGVLTFEFGRVYIKQINRNELIMKLMPESVRELTGAPNYQDWDYNELKKFIFNSLDNYFHLIEEDYQKAK